MKAAILRYVLVEGKITLLMPLRKQRRRVKQLSTIPEIAPWILVSVRTVRAYCRYDARTIRRKPTDSRCNYDSLSDKRKSQQSIVPKSHSICKSPIPTMTNTRSKNSTPHHFNSSIHFKPSISTVATSQPWIRQVESPSNRTSKILYRKYPSSPPFKLVKNSNQKYSLLQPQKHLPLLLSYSCVKTNPPPDIDNCDDPLSFEKQYKCERSEYSLTGI